MIEEGYLEPNDKLFYEKLEERNGILGDRKIAIVERAGRSPRGKEESRGNILWRNI